MMGDVNVNPGSQKDLQFLSSGWEVEGSLLISVCILEGLKRAEVGTILYFSFLV